MTAILTAKQQRFAYEYLIDLNATQAAIRAGYSESGAKQEGSRLLTNVDIKAYINEQAALTAKKTGYDAEWLLDHLGQIATAKISDILDDEDNYLPVSQWPDIWQMMVNGMDVQRVKVGEAAAAINSPFSVSASSFPPTPITLPYPNFSLAHLTLPSSALIATSRAAEPWLPSIP